MNSPPILEPILVVGLNGMFGGTIWVLTHGHMFLPHSQVDFSDGSATERSSLALRRLEQQIEAADERGADSKARFRVLVDHSGERETKGKLLVSKVPTMFFSGLGVNSNHFCDTFGFFSPPFF